MVFNGSLDELSDANIVELEQLATAALVARLSGLVSADDIDAQVMYDFLLRNEPAIRIVFTFAEGVSLDQGTIDDHFFHLYIYYLAGSIRVAKVRSDHQKQQGIAPRSRFTAVSPLHFPQQTLPASRPRLPTGP